MPPRRRFVPRTLCECRRALGDVEQPDLFAAFDDRLPADGATDDGGAAAGDLSSAAGVPLFRLLGKPKAGDWLQTHEEPGQSFPQYFKRMQPKSGGVLPRPACDSLLICPVGKSFSAEFGKRFMPHLIQYCAAFFPGMTIEVLEKPVSLKEVRSRENDFGHKQYLIEDIFSILNTHKDVVSKRRAYCRLGVTLEDIYPGDDWNYVFGQARPLERVGVFSFARHSPLFYQGAHATEVFDQLEAKDLLRWLRTCRHTMVHETCHMLGILHCVYWQCLMNGTNGPGDSCGSSAFLCPVCLRKLLHALGGPPSVSLAAVDGRYAAMEACLQELALEVGGEDVSPGLSRDLAWLHLRREQLKEPCDSPPSAAAPPPPPAPSGGRRAPSVGRVGGRRSVAGRQ